MWIDASWKLSFLLEREEETLIRLSFLKVEHFSLYTFPSTLFCKAKKMGEKTLFFEVLQSRDFRFLNYSEGYSGSYPVQFDPFPTSKQPTG